MRTLLLALLVPLSIGCSQSDEIDALFDPDLYISPEHMAGIYEGGHWTIQNRGGWRGGDMAQLPLPGGTGYAFFELTSFTNFRFTFPGSGIGDPSFKTAWKCNGEFSYAQGWRRIPGSIGNKLVLFKANRGLVEIVFDWLPTVPPWLATQRVELLFENLNPNCHVGVTAHGVFIEETHLSATLYPRNPRIWSAQECAVVPERCE